MANIIKNIIQRATQKCKQTTITMIYTLPQTSQENNIRRTMRTFFSMQNVRKELRRKKCKKKENTKECRNV